MSSICKKCHIFIQRSNPLDGIKCKVCKFEYTSNDFLTAIRKSGLLCTCGSTDASIPTKIEGYGLCECNKYRRLQPDRPATVCKIFVKRFNPLEGIKCKDCNSKFTGKNAFKAIRRSGLLCTCGSTSAPIPTKLEGYGMCVCGNYRRIYECEAAPKDAISKKVSFSKYKSIYIIPSE